jgi:hypothetical protein
LRHAARDALERLAAAKGFLAHEDTSQREDVSVDLGVATIVG